jgi:hypothetical protein
MNQSIILIAETAFHGEQQLPQKLFSERKGQRREPAADDVRVFS